MEHEHRIEVTIRTDEFLTDEDLQDIAKTAMIAINQAMRRRMDVHRQQARTAIETAERIIKGK